MTLREKLTEIVRLASGTNNVHAEVPLIRTEDDLVALFGDGTAADGSRLLRGWLVLAPETEVENVLWCDQAESTFVILGYWGMTNDAEATAQIDMETVVSELVEAGVITVDPSVPAEVTSVAYELRPAELGGFAVWEARLTVKVTEYRSKP